MPNQTSPTLFSGLDYMIRGFKLITDTGLKRFILIPLLINLFIFIALSYFVLQLFGDFNAWLSALLPEWLNFLAYMLWILLFIVFLIGYGYSFTLLTNLIAAPFYGLLSEKVEAKLTGKTPTGESLWQMIPRTIGREIIKLCYLFGFGVLIFLALTLLAFIPLVNVATPLLGFLWSSWLMAIQYVDYPADNHRISFTKLRQQLGSQRWASIGFGGWILLGSMAPIINIFIAPVAVTAGTLYWVESVSKEGQ